MEAKAGTKYKRKIKFNAKNVKSNKSSKIHLTKTKCEEKLFVNKKAQTKTVKSKRHSID